ncbi:MAG: sirohydrochlorin chelatase [Chthoniobacteraceae bacterium]
MNPETALVLMPHGSRNLEWIEPFEKLARTLNAELGAVYLAYMEINPPTLMEVARAIMATPIRRYRLLPMFFAKGSHFFVDIPKQMAEVRAAFPELEGELLDPIGLHPLFTDLVRQVAGENH